MTCAQLFNAEYGIVGNSGQGWTHNTAPTIGVPLFGDAYTLHYEQTPRFPAGVAVPAPDYVLVNMGTNDWVYGVPQNDAGVTNAAVAWLVQMRTYFPTSQVFLVVPFGGFVEPALATAFNRYLAAHPDDTKVSFINLASTAQKGITAQTHDATPQSFDGEHPNAATHLLLGCQLTAALRTALSRSDFNGDGTSHLILQNTTTNQIGVWSLAGAQVVNSALVSDVPDSVYKIVRSGDFRGAGKPDLVFQNQTTGQIVVWYMDGTQMIGGAALDTIPAAGYRVVGTADFNRDGRNDLLFQNDTTGTLVIWYMNGLQYIGGEVIAATVAAGYHVEAIADFDGDGRPDVALRNANGNIALWHPDGGSVFLAESLPVRLDPAFRIAGPR